MSLGFKRLNCFPHLPILFRSFKILYFRSSGDLHSRHSAVVTVPVTMHRIRQQNPYSRNGNVWVSFEETPLSRFRRTVSFNRVSTTSATKILQDIDAFRSSFHWKCFESKWHYKSCVHLTKALRLFSISLPRFSSLRILHRWVFNKNMNINVICVHRWTRDTSNSAILILLQLSRKVLARQDPN